MICEDADLDAAVADATMGIAFQNGEVCFAASRLFVHESTCASEFLERFAAALGRVRIGDAVDPTRRRSARSSRRRTASACSASSSAPREEGVARRSAASGSRATATLAGGFYLAPGDPRRPERARRRPRARRSSAPSSPCRAGATRTKRSSAPTRTEYGLAAGVWTARPRPRPPLRAAARGGDRLGQHLVRRRRRPAARRRQGEPATAARCAPRRCSSTRAPKRSRCASPARAPTSGRNRELKWGQAPFELPRRRRPKWAWPRLERQLGLAGGPAAVDRQHHARHERRRR